MSSNAQTARTSRHPRTQERKSQGFWERMILGTPAPIMVWRLVFIGTVLALVGFGLMMVFSVTSVKPLIGAGGTTFGDLQKQAIIAVLGLGIAAVFMRMDYHAWCRLPVMYGIFIAAAAALVVVLGVGSSAYGSTRWISVAGMTLQPVELIKVVVVILAAYFCAQYKMGEIDLQTFVIQGGLMVAVILGLVLAQPDKGSTLILGLIVMAVMVSAFGFAPPIVALIVVALAAFVILGLSDEYSRERLLGMSAEGQASPAAFNLQQSLYAFGLGGLFGRGLGAGQQKYGYLPMAENDYIFPVVGEELGLIGCLVLLGLFVLLFYSAWRIAKQAPDLLGTLLALGAAYAFAFSVFINILGVMGVLPMTGKPVPFISNGGSALLGSLLLAGVVLSVSGSSKMPETQADTRRRQMSVAGQGRPYEDTGVGTPQVRSFRVVGGRAHTAGAEPRDGGRTGSGRGGSGRDSGPSRGGARRAASTGRAGAETRGRSPYAARGVDAHPEARVTRDSSGRERIDLGRTSTERLRPRSGPTVHDERGSRGRNSRRR